MATTGSRKSWSQELLEEIIGADGVRADFPSVQEQAAYWDKRDAEYEAYLEAERVRQQGEGQ